MLMAHLPLAFFAVSGLCFCVACLPKMPVSNSSFTHIVDYFLSASFDVFLRLCPLSTVVFSSMLLCSTTALLLFFLLIILFDVCCFFAHFFFAVLTGIFFLCVTIISPAFVYSYHVYQGTRRRVRSGLRRQAVPHGPRVSRRGKFIFCSVRVPLLSLISRGGEPERHGDIFLPMFAIFGAPIYFITNSFLTASNLGY